MFDAVRHVFPRIQEKTSALKGRTIFRYGETSRPIFEIVRNDTDPTESVAFAYAGRWLPARSPAEAAGILSWIRTRETETADNALFDQFKPENFLSSPQTVQESVQTLHSMGETTQDTLDRLVPRLLRDWEDRDQWVTKRTYPEGNLVVLTLDQTAGGIAYLELETLQINSAPVYRATKRAHKLKTLKYPQWSIEVKTQDHPPKTPADVKLSLARQFATAIFACCI